MKTILESIHNLLDIPVLPIAQDLLGEKLQKRKNAEIYKAICPFHKEEHPSFFVNPAKNFFVCYGCHEYGTAVKLAHRLLGPEKAAEYFNQLYEFKNGPLKVRNLEYIIEWNG